MSRDEYINSVREVHPAAVVKKEGYSRYGIYNGKNRVPGWSCISEITAWKSAYNQIMNAKKTQQTL